MDVVSDLLVCCRTLRLADGPDEVHINTIAKIEYEKQLKKAKL